MPASAVRRRLGEPARDGRSLTRSVAVPPAVTAPLTDDDVGKTVVDVEGKELGIVAQVEDGRAAVDPDPSLAEQVLASIGWEGEDDEDYVVTEDMLERVDNEVVLRGEL